jgi:Synergist-CTERM protein sorting domain-containing protein
MITFGAAFDGTKLGSIVPLKEKRDGKTVMLNYQSEPTNLAAGQYTWTEKDGRPLPLTMSIQQNSEAYLSVAIRDNSDLDWDTTVNSVLDPVLLAAGTPSDTTGPTNTGGNGYEPGGGCNAGFGLAAFAILLAIAAMRRRERQG